MPTSEKTTGNGRSPKTSAPKKAARRTQRKARRTKERGDTRHKVHATPDLVHPLGHDWGRLQAAPNQDVDSIFETKTDCVFPKALRILNRSSQAPHGAPWCFCVADEDRLKELAEIAGASLKELEVISFWLHVHPNDFDTVKWVAERRHAVRWVAGHCHSDVIAELTPERAAKIHSICRKSIMAMSCKETELLVGAPLNLSRKYVVVPPFIHRKSTLKK